MAPNTPTIHFFKATDTQESSLLFTKLPAELRNKIYELAHTCDELKSNINISDEPEIDEKGYVVKHKTEDDESIDIDSPNHPRKNLALTCQRMKSAIGPISSEKAICSILVPQFTR